MSDSDDYIGHSSEDGEKKQQRFIMVITHGEGKGKSKLIDKKRFIVGRKVGDFIVPDPKVSFSKGYNFRFPFDSRTIMSSVQLFFQSPTK